MKNKFPILVLFAGLGSSFSSSASAQLVGPYKCEDERILPNLHMTQAAIVSGVVYDPSGAIFTQITLQIQNPHDSKVLMSAVVDEKGSFEFGAVPPGEFRLVPVKIVNGKIAKIPGFDPPHSITCVGDSKCELRVTLQVRPTDQPFENCSPK